MFARDDTLATLSAAAARLVVEEGLEYMAAKQQAARQLGLGSRGPWPDNAMLDAAVREHIALFCPESQAQELRALRELALVWLERLADFNPLLAGAVWQGTATRHSDIFVQLYCDDPKTAEFELLDRRIDYHPGTVTGWRGEPVDVLTVRSRCEALGQWVLVHLLIYDRDDMRGALKPDAHGRVLRGAAPAVRRLLEESET
jgi:hypothetical protein